MRVGITFLSLEAIWRLHHTPCIPYSLFCLFIKVYHWEGLLNTHFQNHHFFFLFLFYEIFLRQASRFRFIGISAEEEISYRQMAHKLWHENLSQNSMLCQWQAWFVHKTSESLKQTKHKCINTFLSYLFTKNKISNVFLILYLSIAALKN